MFPDSPDASISAVLTTLIEAFILVGIVVFIFLQDWRSTLIPVLAVPVALVGTFAFMNMLDFSVNLLTLFALVLAIGIVVDNAIVVVEAVHVKMEEGMNAMDATISATKEIAGAVVAITIVMSAVFIPVAFLDGPGGCILPSVFINAGHQYRDFWGECIDTYSGTLCYYFKTS